MDQGRAIIFIYFIEKGCIASFLPCTSAFLFPLCSLSFFLIICWLILSFLDFFLYLGSLSLNFFVLLRLVWDLTSLEKTSPGTTCSIIQIAEETNHQFTLGGLSPGDDSGLVSSLFLQDSMTRSGGPIASSSINHSDAIWTSFGPELLSSWPLM